LQPLVLSLVLLLLSIMLIARFSKGGTGWRIHWTRARDGAATAAPGRNTRRRTGTVASRRARISTLCRRKGGRRRKPGSPDVEPIHQPIIRGDQTSSTTARDTSLGSLL